MSLLLCALHARPDSLSPGPAGDSCQAPAALPKRAPWEASGGRWLRLHRFCPEDPVGGCCPAGGVGEQECLGLDLCFALLQVMPGGSPDSNFVGPAAEELDAEVRPPAGGRAAPIRGTVGAGGGRDRLGLFWTQPPEAACLAPFGLRCGAEARAAARVGPRTVP